LSGGFISQYDADELINWIAGSDMRENSMTALQKPWQFHLMDRQSWMA
jgi:hypothetical protein